MSGVKASKANSPSTVGKSKRGDKTSGGDSSGTTGLTKSALYSIIIANVFSFILLNFFRYTGEPASTKPFGTFEEFYPFYLSQHAELTCRRLHFIGTSIIFLAAILEPRAAPCLFVAALVGYGAFNATKGMESGILEMVAMMFTFVFLMRQVTGKWWKGVMIPITAYGFAWVGHFFFEMNRPATFIYPLYSLMGDFRMWYEIASTKIPF